METEKSIALSEEEKKAIDQSGFSEKQIDITLNKATSTHQAPKQGTFRINSKEKKEYIILEKSSE